MRARIEYGPDLVLAPIREKGVREQDVYLPAGERWFAADGDAPAD